MQGTHGEVAQGLAYHAICESSLLQLALKDQGERARGTAKAEHCKYCKLAALSKFSTDTKTCELRSSGQTDKAYS